MLSVGEPLIILIFDFNFVLLDVLVVIERMHPCNPNVQVHKSRGDCGRLRRLDRRDYSEVGVNIPFRGNLSLFVVPLR